MKVGITYDLREDYINDGYNSEELAEFDKIETIDGIDEALKKLGFETVRIGNIKSLVKRLSENERWDIVFNIAEGMHGLAREAQVPALLDAYQIPYTFSDSYMLNICLHKGTTKSLVRSFGVATPDYHVIEDETDINKVNLKYPLFVKPVGEGTGKGINALSKVNNFEELEFVSKKLLQDFKQPLLVEKYLCGREFTVGLVGTGEDAKVVGGMEIIINKNAEENGYTYFNKENYEGLVSYEKIEGKLAKECEELALKAWKCLNLRDGGRIDIKLDENDVPNFLEVNPLAGLNPITSDLPIMCSMIGITYQELINMIMQSAIKRLNYVTR